MHWPSWLVWYKKPEYRDIKEYSTAISSNKRSFSPDGRSGSSVPSQLKLERVLDNKTCSPMSLFDFYMYLKHIEFSEENLEFYIWYKNYEKTYAKENGSLSSEKDDYSFRTSESGSSDVNLQKKSPFFEAPAFSHDPEASEDTMALITQLISSGSLCSQGVRCKLACRDQNKACKQGKSCKIPPTFSSVSLNSADPGRRRELGAVANRFLVPGSPKELNLPPSMRNQALNDLQSSSDPIHLKPIADHVYQLLRNCSHRNFVRLGVSNGTFETICVATGLGIALSIAGFLAALLLAFTPYRNFHSRWTVLGIWPMWWLGMSLIMSGLRGSCFFLLLFTRRQPLPWERFAEEESGAVQRTGLMKIISRLMIFDRKFRVKDVHLRQLQHKIVFQSLFFGAVFATCSVLLFIFLPVWA
ncbi:regulator of G protein signaling superfamily [Thozetella sp. PMI_491]|nr:regulator of G protein signaling superfamily [Thozetella sp. PMI_491]